MGMKELLVAGFSTTHAALLAQAAMTRQSGDICISPKDMALVSLDAGNQVRILESISIGKSTLHKDSFWKKLAEILISQNADFKTEAILSKLDVIGIDATAREQISKIIPAQGCAILAMVDEGIRTLITAILSNCQGEVARFRIKCNRSDECLETLFLHPGQNTPEGEPE